MPPHTHSGSSIDAQPTLRGRNEEKQAADRSPLPNVPSDENHQIKRYLGQGSADPTGLFLKSRDMKVIQELDRESYGAQITSHYPQVVVLDDEEQDADGESSHRCEAPQPSITDSNTPRQCIDCHKIITEEEGVHILASDSEPDTAEPMPTSGNTLRASATTKPVVVPKGAVGKS